MKHFTLIQALTLLLFLAALVAYVSYDQGQTYAMDKQAMHFNHHDNF